MKSYLLHNNTKTYKGITCVFIHEGYSKLILTGFINASGVSKLVCNVNDNTQKPALHPNVKVFKFAET